MFNLFAIIIGIILSCYYIVYANINMLPFYLIFIPIYIINFSVYFLFDFISKKVENIENSEIIYKYDKNFINIYNELKSKHFNTLENYRKKIYICRNIEKISLYFMVIFLFIFAYCFGVLPYFSTFNHSSINIFAMHALFMITFPIIGLIQYSSTHIICYRKYFQIFKNDIIPSLVKSINYNLDYSYNEVSINKDISTDVQKEYINANFDGVKITKIIDDDTIKGKINEKFFFNMSDILAYSRNPDDNEEYQVFSGLFTWSTTHKDIKTYLKIYLNGTNDNPKMKKNHVSMDYSKFEELFDVYCKDKILALRILTPDIMQDIIDFYEKYQIYFEICYRNNKIYLRFFTYEMFEPRLSEESLNINTMCLYYTIIKFVIKITQKMNKITEDIEI